MSPLYPLNLSLAADIEPAAKDTHSPPPQAAGQPERFSRSHTALGHEAEIRALRDCHASLSRREREVMALVVSGLLNKQVGGELGISEITVKAHRGKVMRKMKADSLADLVKMDARLRLAPAPKG